MAFANNVGFLAAASGDGDFGGGGAALASHLSMTAGLTNGQVYSYKAYSVDRTEWEIGRGAYSSASTGSLARTTIVKSSNADAKVDFTTAPIVIVTPITTDFQYLPDQLFTTRGDMLRAGASGIPERFAKGTQYQVLTGGANDPTWGALALDQASAVSGTLPSANLPASTTSVAGVTEKATDAEVYAAAEDKNLTADLIETASAEVTLTDGASPSFDWDAGINRLWTMAANRAMPNPTNGQPGTYRTVRVIGNDGTDRTLTFGTQYEGDLPTLTDIDNVKQYILYIRCVTSSHFVVSAQNATVS